MQNDNSWTEIKNQSDVDDFMLKTDICDDESFEIVSMNYENHNLLLVIESRTTGKIEMFFEYVCYFRNSKLGRSYCKYDGRCYLEFRTDIFGRHRNDRLIVWTDNHSVLSGDTLFDSLSDSDNVVIVARKMKYHFK